MRLELLHEVWTLLGNLRGTSGERKRNLRGTYGELTGTLRETLKGLKKTLKGA